MFIFNVLVLLFVLAGGFWFAPICLAKDLKLKSQRIIKGLSIANVVSFIVGGIMVIVGINNDINVLEQAMIPLAVVGILCVSEYIFIVHDVHEERILDNGIKYDNIIWNSRNHIYDFDMFGWGVYVILYIVELLVVFMPAINIASKMELNLFDINELMNYWNNIFSPLKELSEDMSSMNNVVGVFLNIDSISAYVMCTVAIVGILMHIIVRDTRKTVFFDCILQGIYIVFTFAIACFCYIEEILLKSVLTILRESFSLSGSTFDASKFTIQFWGPATFFIPLMVCITMLIAVLPQTCSLMLAKSK